MPPAGGFPRGRRLRTQGRLGAHLPDHRQRPQTRDTARYGRLDLSRSISAHIPLAEADRAVKQLADKSGNPIRLILVP